MMPSRDPCTHGWDSCCDECCCGSHGCPTHPKPEPYFEEPPQVDEDEETEAAEQKVAELEKTTEALRETKVEQVAAQFHDAWMRWSKKYAPQVDQVTRTRWRGLWIPYDQLSEEMKEYDRKEARAALKEVGKNVISS